MPSTNETAVTTAMVNRRNVEEVVEIYQSVKTNKGGKVIFLASPAYSGRSDTLLAIGERLSREEPRPEIITGRCTDGRYVPLEVSYEKEAALTGETLALAAKVLAKATPGVGELTDFAAQLLQTGLAAKTTMGSGPNTYSPNDVKELIRRSARTEPLVLLIDDLDQAHDHWLLDLLREMAPEIDRMRLLLVATLNGPPQPGEYDDSEPAAITRARGCLARGMAEWQSIRPLTQNEISAWLGPAQPGIIGHLHGITSGYPRRVHRLLCDWEERGLIRQADRSREWEWTSKERPPLDIVKDVIYAKLKRLFDPTDADLIEEIRAWLAYGAMEGRTFTAAAVAQATNCDEDELIDTIDEVLLWDREENPDGLLLEAESITITGNRTRWRYRFSDHFHWQALAQGGFTKYELASARHALIQSLLDTYAPDTLYVAGALARLLREIGDKETARQFQRIADFRVPREQIREKAFHLLAINKDDWNEWELRQATRYLLEAAGMMLPLCPYKETLLVAEEARRLAQLTDSRHDIAVSCLYCGYALLNLGDSVSAQERFIQAFGIAQISGDHDLEASCCNGLGSCYESQGRYEEAEPPLIRALEIREKVRPGHPSTATALNNLAELYRSQGRYKEAEPLLKRALEIREKALGPEHPDTATSLNNLAALYNSQGRYEEAEPLFTRAIEIAEKALGQEHPSTVLFLENYNQLLREMKRRDESTDSD